MDIKALKGDDLIKFLKSALKDFERSDHFKEAKAGREYYRGNQDIDNKKRLGYNDEGRVVVLRGLPNTILKDNQYAKLVDQKTQYILSEQPTITCDDSEVYAEALTAFLDRRFMRTFGKITQDALNCRIGWLYVYPDGDQLGYKKIDTLEIIPIWRDTERESLSALIRRRTDSEWDSDRGEIRDRHYLEYYTDEGVITFEVIEGERCVLVSDHGYFKDEDGNQFNWGKIPFIYWRYTADEINLLSRVKTLIDVQNLILSVFGDRMLEDNRNTILVIKGYGGENPNEIRGEMNQSGVLQVAGDGAVDALNIEINAENFQTYLRIIKEKIIENGRGVDAKNDKASTAPNELNIKSMYNDIDLDANGMELEYQASFEHFQWFFKKVYGFDEKLNASLSFKRNIMVNMAENVTMIKDSPYLSLQTQLEANPLVKDVSQEMDRIKEEREESSTYHGGWPMQMPVGDPDDNTER